MDKGFSSEFLTKEALSLADLIINKYSSQEGGIFEKVDVQMGKVLDFHYAIDELGDYIQYIIYLGVLTTRKEYIDWGVRTLNIISQNYQSGKGLFYHHSGKHWIRKTLLSINNADTITGLVSAYIYSENEFLKTIIDRFIKGVFHHFTDGNYVTYGYLLGDKFKVSLSNLLFTGYFVEEVLNYIEFTHEKDHMPRIKAIIEGNLSNKYFSRYGIFQARIPLGLWGICWGLIYKVFKRENLKTTFLVKDNVYFLFALLKYYSLVRSHSIKESITKTYDNLFKLFILKGVLYNSWHPGKGCIGSPSPLALSHSLIELQLDLYHEFGDESILKKAIELTDGWLCRQSLLGVINETILENEHYSLLDSNVDFAINLLKLSEKTDCKEYLEKALEITAGIIEYFKAPMGYYFKIETVNGNPLQPDIETKYLGLLLKLFIILLETIRNKSIFGNPIIRNLARDR